MDKADSKAEPVTIAAAPPSTFAQLAAEAPRSSWNSAHPQKMPTRVFVFHRGKAMARPTSRIAKIVSVLATAHNAPARTAHKIRWGCWRRSRTTEWVPFITTGNVQRARKTPSTMQKEIAKGRNPDATRRAGASAAPSHTPAAKAHAMPSRYRTRGAGAAGELRAGSGVVAEFEIKTSLPKVRSTDTAAPVYLPAVCR